MREYTLKSMNHTLFLPHWVNFIPSYTLSNKKKILKIKLGDNKLCFQLKIYQKIYAANWEPSSMSAKKESLFLCNSLGVSLSASFYDLRQPLSHLWLNCTAVHKWTHFMESYIIAKPINVPSLLYKIKIKFRHTKRRERSRHAKPMCAKHFKIGCKIQRGLPINLPPLENFFVAFTLLTMALK